MRVLTWCGHLALPVAGLWLLLARPQLDLHWEHHGAHFWLVLAAAAVSVGLALAVDAKARRISDPRLLLVSLAFLTAAGFLALHALLTPRVLVAGSTAGFVLAVPAGLVLAAVPALASGLEPAPAATRRILALRGPLRVALLVLLLAWAVLTAVPGTPLAAPLPPDASRGPLLACAVAGAALYGLAALRYFALHRRRPGVVLLSVVTAFTLLAEAVVVAGLAPSWRLSWWEWHVLVLGAFAFVAYSAHAQFRREGSSSGVFSGIATAASLADLRRDHSAALEELVDAMRSGPDGGWAHLRSRLADRFDLTERQLDVLERGAAALAGERAHAARLAALVAAGQRLRVVAGEDELLPEVLTLVRSAFRGDAVGVAVLRNGRLCEVPAPGAAPAPPGRLVAAAVARGEPVEDPRTVVLPLTVKGCMVGVLHAHRPTGAFGERDRSVLTSLAAQLSIAVENARLYRQLDGLFRSYLPPDVATALIADPERASLGGALADVSVLMADLAGFTRFAETTPPPDVVAMLNTYYAAVAPAVLAEGGIVVQFVGDGLMALFGAPASHPDHPERAVRAATALQAATERVARPGWPRFRVGVNTGPALVGNVGSDTMRTFTAIGDTTNLAARLEASAPPGGVVVAAATLARLADRPSTRELPPLTVKGKRLPVQAFLVDA
ncbi:MAG TPA: adenylate/guanylate cyclase domain-containing protein [Pseudonocardia sp.]|nr:adenylate/guanylate cyclase domain-containing protein [Pseudonocardia sp.]